MPADVSEAPREAAPGDFDENGVDLTLIRYTLSLSPTERLRSVENFMNAMSTVRRPVNPVR
jgi:hypothetical protein